MHLDLLEPFPRRVTTSVVPPWFSLLRHLCQLGYHLALPTTRSVTKHFRRHGIRPKTVLRPGQSSHGSVPKASSQPSALITDICTCWYRRRMAHSKAHATVVLLLWLCSVHLVRHNHAGTPYSWLQTDMIRRRTGLCFFSVVFLWPRICIIMDVARLAVAGITAHRLASTVLLSRVFVFCLVRLDRRHKASRYHGPSAILLCQHVSFPRCVRYRGTVFLVFPSS